MRYHTGLDRMLIPIVAQMRDDENRDTPAGRNRGRHTSFPIVCDQQEVKLEMDMGLCDNPILTCPQRNQNCRLRKEWETPCMVGV